MYARFSLAALVVIALLALAGIAMTSLIVESVTFRPINNPVNNSSPVVTVNAPYLRETRLPQEVSLTVFYRGYGNTALRLTPFNVFHQGLLQVNGHNVGFRSTPAGADIIDLKPWLHPGHNIVVAWLARGWGNTVGVAIGSPLFGWDATQSCFTLLFIASLLALIWLFLARQGHDVFTCFLFTLACGCYFESLYFIQHFDQPQDLEWNALYIQYISDHFFSPLDYNGFNGIERAQPPTYYWLCALIARVLQSCGIFDVWTGMRLLSLACHIAFSYFGMRAMAVLLNKPAFYLAVALLLFWPSGMIYATRINNDVLMYPFYAASFYYTLIWFKATNAAALVKALASCGLAFMVKTSALVPASIIGVVLLFQLSTRRITVHTLLKREFLTGWGMLAAGVLFNAARSIAHFQFSGKAPFSFMQFLHPWHGGYKLKLKAVFSPDIGNLFSYPFFSDKDDTIWRCHIKALLFNNTQWWPHPQPAPYMHGLYLAMLVYMAVFVFTLSRRKIAALLPLLAGAVLPFIASYVFVLIGGLHANTDIHYIWPVIISIIMIFMLAVQETKARGWPIFYYAGNLVAGGFIVTSIIFTQWQWL